MRKLLIASGVIGGLGAYGAYATYQRRLRENNCITAADYNKKQDAQQLDAYLAAIAAAVKARGTATAAAAESAAPRVELYRYTTCPFCGTVKAFLDVYGVAHSCVEVEPMFKGEIAAAEYKKVPQLRFVDKAGGKPAGHLVDSDIIVETLAPLVGCEAELRDPDVQKWRGWARNQLVRFLVLNINSSLAEAWRGYSYIDGFDTIPLANKLFLKVMGAPVMYLVAQKKTLPTLLKAGDMKAGDDPRKRLHEEVGKFVADGLGPKQQQLAAKSKAAAAVVAFHGGAKPDLADVDVYGVLQSVRGHRVYDDVLANTAIKPWLDAMDKATGKPPYPS